MSATSEQFQKHVKTNSSIYRSAINNGVITEDDIKAAGNAGGKYSYAEQDAALKRINDAFNSFVTKNPNDERLKSFVAGIPQLQKFTPNKEDWRDYNQEQMGRLAEEMKFNWKNKDDRSEMMKILTDETIRKDRQKIYEDYKKEHPAAAFINENILAPNTSKRSERGEDIKNTDVALDVANGLTYAFPGAGAAKTVLGKGLMLGADAALQGAVGAASDVNLGNELGLHNITYPLIGAGTGASAELAPRLAKTFVDNVTGGFGGEIGKSASDAAEGLITKYFGNQLDMARASLAKDAKIADNTTTNRINMSAKNKAQLKREGKDITPNAKSKRDAINKDRYVNDINLWQKIADKFTDEDYNRFYSDPRFRLLIEDAVKKKELNKAIENATTKKEKIKAHFNKFLDGAGSDAARGISRSAGRGILLSLANRDRNQNAVPTIEELYASPELADYFRLKKRGYDAQIPSKYKDREDELEESRSRIEKLYGF